MTFRHPHPDHPHHWPSESCQTAPLVPGEDNFSTWAGDLDANGFALPDRDPKMPPPQSFRFEIA